ncbi:Metallo-dependent phosphatase-like protein [Mycena amicta]|nr:Metallo-dependent phosphatase-like protein [Mycena amicta]
MKKLAEEDVNRGRTSLSDGFPPGGFDARDFFKQIPYDVLAIGNHELYKYTNTFDVHTNFGRHYEGRYLSSNVNITVFDENNQTTSVPVYPVIAQVHDTKVGLPGRDLRSFLNAIRRGRTVTAFGVFYEFTTNDVNTTVQPVEEIVNEPWEEPDIFLLVVHMPVSRSGWLLVFDAIRKEHPTTPILIFGGHLHIRDCGVDLDEGGSGPLNFSRRYLDTNPVTYKYHTGKSDETFYRDEERTISPMAYLRDSYPSNGSLLSLSAEEVVPFAISLNTTRVGVPFVLIISSGSQRFDIYKGPFTRNDQLTASPFVNRYIFIPDVPFEAATKSELTLGYVTTDSCPGLGDDVPHTPIPVFPVPPFIASRTPDASNTVIDITARVYTRSDTAEYSPVRSNEVLGLYAEVAWNQSR